MANFPTTFAKRVEPLQPVIGERGNAALAKLQERGFFVATGLTEYFAGAVGVMGAQPHIREYCPRDASPDRFGTLPSTEAWLQKGEGDEKGRGMFLLLRETENKKSQPMGPRLIGYGWTGVEPNYDILPDHPITSAYRIGEEGLKQGLGKPFIQAVVSGTNALFAPGEGIGLETWQSNHAAGMYLAVGFVAMNRPDQMPELRDTLDPEAVGGKVADTRLFMGYPAELLA